MLSVFGKEYDVSKCVRIINPVQAGLYYDHGAELVDHYRGYNNKWVWIFYRDETDDLFARWRNHELTFEDNNEEKGDVE